MNQANPFCDLEDFASQPVFHPAEAIDDLAKAGAFFF